MSSASRQTDDGSTQERRIMKPGLLYAVVKLGATLTLKLFFRLKVSGAENVPADGGVLIASNHQSYLDPAIVTASNRRPVSFMARDSLFRNRLFGWFIRKLCAFPVRRGGADHEALRAAVARLREGEILLVFPEGTRTRDGSLGRLRNGPATLAFRADVPIVPAVIKGAFEAWPRSQKIFRFRPLSIAYGRPIPPPATGERETHDEIRRELQNSLEALMKET